MQTRKIELLSEKCPMPGSGRYRRKKSASICFDADFVFLTVLLGLLLFFLFDAGLGFLDDRLLDHRGRLLVPDEIKGEAAPAAGH